MNLLACMKIVDIGDGQENPVKALQILLFRVVAINKSWKLPVVYLPIVFLTAEQKTAILINWIENIEECVGTTFNRASANFAMCKSLGWEISWKTQLKFDSLIEGLKYIVHADGIHYN